MLNNLNFKSNTPLKVGQNWTTPPRSHIASYIDIASYIYIFFAIYKAWLGRKILIFFRPSDPYTVGHHYEFWSKNFYFNLL